MLDDGRQRRYCLIIFAGCSSQPPPHRPMWSTFEPAVSGHGSFPTFSIHSLVVCSCDVTSAKPITESDCASVPGQAQIRPCTTRPNHHAATAVRLSEVDASGDALSAPIHREQQRHRRSEWAGVSWPMDDDRERDAADGTGSAPVRKTVDAVALARTRRFARSFAPWRGRPHASASSWN